MGFQIADYEVQSRCIGGFGFCVSSFGTFHTFFGFQILSAACVAMCFGFQILSTARVSMCFGLQDLESETPPGVNCVEPVRSCF